MICDKFNQEILNKRHWLEFEYLSYDALTQLTVSFPPFHLQTHRSGQSPWLDKPWERRFRVAWIHYYKCIMYTYGRKSADRTEPHFGVIFFVFLSTFFGNLEVCGVKTCNIFWKYMSATWSTCLCLDHYFIGGLFNCPYILCPYMGVKCMGN